MRLIDTHVHFWDLRRADLSYPWLQPGVPHPIIGDIDSIKAPLYDGQALFAEARFAGVERIVHVEAAATAATPDIEEGFARSVAADAGLACALVTHRDLATPSAPRQLAGLALVKDVRGIRDFGVVDYLKDPDQAGALDASLDAMDQAGLLLDLDCAYENMELAGGMAERHPGLVVVLEHIGYPRSRDDGYFAAWAPAVRSLAGAPNVHCKLSGLGMTDRNWTVASLRRWVETCLEAFGPQRCMYGSNWPVDRIASSYDALVTAFAELIDGCTAAEKQAICFDNAEQLYFSAPAQGRPTAEAHGAGDTPVRAVDDRGRPG